MRLEILTGGYHQATKMDGEEDADAGIDLRRRLL